MSASANIPGLSKNSIRWAVRLLLPSFGLVLATAAVYLSFASQPVRRAKIAEIVGKPNADRVLVNNQPLKPGAEIVSGQQVTTQADTRVGFEETGAIAARLGHESALILENDCFQLTEGRMVISGSQGCLGVATIKGTQGIYTLERIGSLGEIKVLSGKIDISVPTPGNIRSISLKENQKLTISLTGDDVGPVRLMLPMEVENILIGELFQGFQGTLLKQAEIIGLQPKAIAPAPKPIPSVAPAPAPLPTPSPDESAVAPSDGSASDDKQSHDLGDQVANRYDYDRHPDLGADSQPAYNQPIRRRRLVEPTDERSSYRRKWRSPHASPAYRRSDPSYSAPAETPAIIPEAPPSMEQPHVPEVPPSQPITPPQPVDSPPLPIIVEPLLEGPMLPIPEEPLPTSTPGDHGI